MSDSDFVDSEAEEVKDYNSDDSKSELDYNSDDSKLMSDLFPPQDPDDGLTMEERRKKMVAEGKRNSSAPPPLLNDNQSPRGLEVVMTPLSHIAAPPNADTVNMDHMRSGTMLDKDQMGNEKWYSMNNDKDSDEYDGSPDVVCRYLHKMLDGMYTRSLDDPELHNFFLKVNDCVMRGSFADIRIDVHIPILSLQPGVDDRSLGPEVEGDGADQLTKEDMLKLESKRPFFVCNRKLKTSRSTWDPTDTCDRLINTKFKFSCRTSLGCNSTVQLSFSKDGEPCIHCYKQDGPPKVHIVKDRQAFLNVVDFTQLNETELSRARPPKFVPARVKLLALSKTGSVSGLFTNDELTVTLLLIEVGSRIRFDKKYYVFEDGRWKPPQANNSSTLKSLKAAYAQLKHERKELQERSDFQTIFMSAVVMFAPGRGLDFSLSGPGAAADEETKKRARKREKDEGCDGLVKLPEKATEKGDFLCKILPWIEEDGFARSFERNKMIGFNNGYQQMSPPYAFLKPSPEHRVMVHMDCDLPVGANVEEMMEKGQRLLLDCLLPIFLDPNVALREMSKLAALFSGGCSTLWEANFRPVLGPYNESSGRYASRCGKNTFMRILQQLFNKCDQNIATSLNRSFLTTQFKMGVNYSELQGIETKLAHLIDEGDKREGGESQTRVGWSPDLKKIWTGGAATPFGYSLKYENHEYHELRTNALYVLANNIYIGKVDVWSKLEVTPIPHVADISENQWFKDNNVLTFPVDSKLADFTMPQTMRESCLFYLIKHCIEIKQDPSKAYPVTHLHLLARDKLREVADGDANTMTTLAEKDANFQVQDILHEILVPCLPKMDAVDLHKKQVQFQESEPKGDRCFCGKKAAEACSFIPRQVYEKMQSMGEIQLCGVFVDPKRPNRLTKLTTAIQTALGLDPTGIGRKVNGNNNHSIFGWKLKSESVDGAVCNGELNDRKAQVAELSTGEQKKEGEKKSAKKKLKRKENEQAGSSKKAKKGE